MVQLSAAVLEDLAETVDRPVLHTTRSTEDMESGDAGLNGGWIVPRGWNTSEKSFSLFPARHVALHQDPSGIGQDPRFRGGRGALS